MKRNVEYRRLGQNLTKGKILNLFLVGLIFSSLLGLISSIGAMYGPTFDPETLVLLDPGNPLIVQVMSLMTIMVSGYVTYAVTKMYIGVTHNEQPQIDKVLLVGPKEQPVKAPLLSFLSSLFIGLWTILFVIPGIIKTYSYAMATFLLVQEKDLGPVDAITKSRQFMNGKKMQLFLLDFSYIGWYLLSLFTLGVLSIWVSAWHQTARTLFFQDAYQAK